MVVMDMAVAEMAATAPTTNLVLRALEPVAAPLVASVQAELDELMGMLRVGAGVKVRALVRQVPVTLAEDQVEAA